MTKRKAAAVPDEPTPRDQWIPKYNLKDPGSRIDPKRINELIDRVFA
jgi:hypothetical protein